MTRIPLPDENAVGRQLAIHLPPGSIWPRQNASVVGTISTALGAGMRRLMGRAADLLQDVPHDTLSERLPEWEQTLGLPDPCLGPSPTMEQRRRSVRVAIAARGGQSIAYFTNVALQLGVTITVQEFAPFRVTGRVGSRIFGSDWAHLWVVTLPPTRIEYFRAGDRVGGRLRTWGDSQVECVLTALKPAHTILRFAYTSGGGTTAPLDQFVLDRDILA